MTLDIVSLIFLTLKMNQCLHWIRPFIRETVEFQKGPLFNIYMQGLGKFKNIFQIIWSKQVSILFSLFSPVWSHNRYRKAFVIQQRFCTLITLLHSSVLCIALLRKTFERTLWSLLTLLTPYKGKVDLFVITRIV